MTAIPLSVTPLNEICLERTTAVAAAPRKLCHLLLPESICIFDKLSSFFQKANTEKDYL